MDFAQEIEALRPAIKRFVASRLANRGIGDGIEDVTQAAYVAAWERREAFDSGTGTAGLRAWLRQIAEYKAQDFAKAIWCREKWLERPVFRESIEEASPVEMVPDFTDVEQTALENIEKQEQRELLYSLIARCQSLSTCERQALLLRCAGDLVHAELGRVMGISEGNARVIWHRATEKLKEAVEK